MNTTHLKNFLLYISIIGFMCSCGSKSDIKGFETDDLRYIPLRTADGTYTYVDTKTGNNHGCYDFATLYHEGYAVVVPNDADGYIFIDHNQEQVFPDTFASATIFNEGIAMVSRRGQPLTAIDRKGNTLFELKEAEAVTAFHDGTAMFLHSDAEFYDFVDRKGNKLNIPSFNNSYTFFENDLLAVYELGDCDGWGLVNKKGENVSPCGFDRILFDREEGYIKTLMRYNNYTALKQERIPVKINGKWGVIDSEGNYIINPQFDLIVLDGDNYLFKKNRRFGWCDSKGKYIINPQFRDALPSEGADLMAVKGDDGYGYINIEGKWVIEEQFDDALPFMPSGIAFVADQGGDWGAINTKGEWVINPQFDRILPISKDMALVVVGNNVGIINTKGEYLVQPDYDDCTEDLLYNRYGISSCVEAESDFVDVSAIASYIVEAISELKTTTTGELRKVLDERKFSKKGGDIEIYDKSQMRNVNLILKANNINAWNHVSDGWFGYNYVFSPDVPISSYTLRVKLFDRNANFTNEIATALKEQLASTGSADVVEKEIISVVDTPERKIITQLYTIYTKCKILD